MVRDFRAALPTAEIYVYDNNSRDNTVAAARAAGVEMNGLSDYWLDSSTEPAGTAAAGAKPLIVTSAAVRSGCIAENSRQG